MIQALAQVTMNPDPSQLPGGHVLQNITDGIGGWAIVLALVALMVSAVVWALGSNSQNRSQCRTRDTADRCAWADHTQEPAWRRAGAPARYNNGNLWL
jgi:hypothetical protein